MPKIDLLPDADAHRPPTPGWKPWVYLASGLGFSHLERASVIPKIVAALEAAGGTAFTYCIPARCTLVRANRPHGIVLQ